MIITEKIKENFKNYDELADVAYDMDYSRLWNRNMYQGNVVFDRLKEKYNIKENPLNRAFIINLFKQDKVYDAFLCAMVWGKIGLNVNSKKVFNSVFNEINKQNLESKLKNVVDYLKSNDVKNAYESLLNYGDNPKDIKGKNKIDGVDVSFFTKLLYFAGSSIEGLSVKPLIYDSQLEALYYKILSMERRTKPRGSYNRYKDYCDLFEQARIELGLKTSGHLEALLFTNTVKDWVNSI